MNRLRLSAQRLIARGCQILPPRIVQPCVLSVRVKASISTTRRHLSSAMASPPLSSQQEEEEGEQESHGEEHTREWDEYDEDSKEDNWMRNFQQFKKELDEIRRERGLSDSDPAPFPRTKSMKNWISKFRYYYKLRRFGNGPKDGERIKMLEAIGVSIDPFDTRWETQFEKLQEFFRERGCFPYDIDPDKLDDDGRRLWEWTMRQKMHYRAYKNKDPSGTLTEERIAKIEGIGFSWSKRNDLWMQRYQELIDYKEHHGDTLVPSSYQANQSLATWTQEQRTQYRRWQLGRKPCSLTTDRVALMEEIGFRWDAQQAKWDEKYKELARHVEVNGPGTYPTRRANPLLHDWVGNQRKEYRKLIKGQRTRLAGMRKELLDKLGFRWPTDV